MPHFEFYTWWCATLALLPADPDPDPDPAFGVCLELKFLCSTSSGLWKSASLEDFLRTRPERETSPPPPEVFRSGVVLSILGGDPGGAQPLRILTLFPKVPKLRLFTFLNSRF